MKAFLWGWHGFRAIEIPAPAPSDLRVPASRGECGLSMAALDFVRPPEGRIYHYTDPVVLQRVFKLTSIVTGRANYQEEGHCTVDPRSGEQLDCPCPTCKEGWTTPGQPLATHPSRSQTRRPPCPTTPTSSPPPKPTSPSKSKT